MPHLDLEKEFANINKFYGDSSLMEHLKTTVQLKNDSYTLGIMMFTAGTKTHGGKGAASKDRKEQRKKITRFFKEKKKKIHLGNDAYIMALPDQLAAVIKWIARVPGYTSGMSISAANELFSFVTVSDGRKDVFPQLKQMAMVLDTFGALDKTSIFTADLRFSRHKLNQITPLPIGSGEAVEGEFFPVPDDLHSFQRTWGNFQAMDKKAVALVEPGLIFLDRLSLESVFPVRLALLSSGLEMFFKTPAKRSAAYFSGICREASDKIDPGATILKQSVADQFHRIRLSLSPGTAEGKEHDVTVSGTEPERKITDQMEVFYRALLRKAIDDPNFLKTTLPKLRSNLKKDLKKQQVADEKWTRFPWKLFAKLARKARQEF